MRGDIPSAAYRLLTKLPVRTHEKKEMQRETFVRAGGNRPARAVSINGTEYKSMNTACKALSIHTTQIIRMIERGEAHYVY